MKSVGIYLFEEEYKTIIQKRGEIASKNFFSNVPKMTAVLERFVTKGLVVIQDAGNVNLSEVNTYNKRLFRASVGVKRRRYNLMIDDDVFEISMRWGYKNIIITKVEIFRFLILIGAEIFRVRK